MSVAHNDRTGAIAGLILRKTGDKGQFRRIGMFMNDSDAEVTNVAPLIARHRPALDPDDYEQFDEDTGYSTLTIV